MATYINTVTIVTVTVMTMTMVVVMVMMKMMMMMMTMTTMVVVVVVVMDQSGLVAEFFLSLDWSSRSVLTNVKHHEIQIND